MTKQQRAVDGFVPRRDRRVVSGYSSLERSSAHDAAGIKRALPTPQSHELVRPRPVSRAEIDNSLRQIDETHPELTAPKTAKPKLSRKKLIKRIAIALAILLLIVGGWLAVRFVMFSNNVFKGNLLGLANSRPLQQDADGRSNILIFGTSEDDEDGNHPGAYLTDSIMVLSIDQTKKDAYMVSIPRDLWVEYGRACPAGYQEKINSLFDCVSEGGKKQEEGAKALAAKISEVLGVDIQYQVHLNYTVVREAVDAVGGVDVDIMGNGPVPAGTKPGSVLDRNFDWKCGYQCYYVKYEPGVHHLDGEHALALARARNAQGGYGLVAGNFDREVNQQKILTALREKSLSVGTLSNLAKVAALLDALGSNLRTSFSTEEIGTLISLGKDIKSESIQSISLADEKNPVVETGSVGSISVVKPIAGLFDYSAIRVYIKKQISADPMVKEEPVVEVYNASGIVGAAQKEADKLVDMGFEATAGNAPAGDYAEKTIYVINDKKPASLAKLEEIYGIKATPGAPALQHGSGADFVLVIGRVTAVR